uniref:Metalloendopeptidase n=1 Tax=Strongyloides papillosus TaxID=174720 RepID=A0A0N5CH95_STREA
MKKIFFVIIFILLLISECLSKKYKKNGKPLKNPPPYAGKYSKISVYVKKEFRQNVKAILDDISKNSCLNFNLPSKKINRKSGINIYETKGNNYLKISYNKKTPTTLKLQKYIFKNRTKLAFQIGRALGMIPEISRPDRDKYVTINWKNIRSSHKKYYQMTKYNYSYYTTLKLQKHIFKNRTKLAFQIGRALGMIPEISRPDRDRYVTINWKNIKSSSEKYYQKTTYNYSYYPNVEFDFGSIMLVDPLFGSSNGKPTYTYNRYAFQAEEESQKIYDPNHIFSYNDVKFLNGMYCRKKCKKNYCKNGGFPGKNCKCICPFHFEGEKCEIPKKSTGDCLQTKEYTATYDLKFIQYKGKTGKCNYVIWIYRIVVTEVQLALQFVKVRKH